VKRRLELLYPGTHFLEINEQGNSFNVKLKLKIEKLNSCLTIIPGLGARLLIAS
jgi:hypothetical protein